MSEVKYEDTVAEFVPANPVTQPTPRFSDMLIAWGIASNPQQAERILLGLCAGALLAAFFVYRWSHHGASSVSPQVMDQAMRAVQYLPR